MTEHEFNNLIQKYRDGQATEKEKARLDAWFDSLHHNDEKFTWNKEDEDLQFEAIRSRIIAAKHPSRIIPLYSARWLKVAASLLILIVSSYVIWHAAIRNETILIATESGHMQKTILSDGTLVWLKGNSSLQFPERFDDGERTVYLRGEALFEVAKDPANPFVIRCGGLSAKVLGTSFNIKAREKEIELMVLTGKVQLYADNNLNSVFVLPHQKIIYDGLPEQLKTKVAQTDKVIMTQGTEYNMAFRNAPMRTIFDRIERKFNREVRTQNSHLENCLITADFTDQSLENTLRMVSHILGFEYEIGSDAVTIKGGGCE